MFINKLGIAGDVIDNTRIVHLYNITNCSDFISTAGKVPIKFSPITEAGVLAPGGLVSDNTFSTIATDAYAVTSYPFGVLKCASLDWPAALVTFPQIIDSELFRCASLGPLGLALIRDFIKF